MKPTSFIKNIVKRSISLAFTFLFAFAFPCAARAKFIKNPIVDTVIKQSNLIADGAKPKLISKQFSFTEGPAVDKAGNIFFTDQPNDQIWKYDLNGRLSLFMNKPAVPTVYILIKKETSFPAPTNKISFGLSIKKEKLHRWLSILKEKS